MHFSSYDNWKLTDPDDADRDAAETHLEQSGCSLVDYASADTYAENDVVFEPIPEHYTYSEFVSYCRDNASSEYTNFYGESFPVITNDDVARTRAELVADWLED